MNFYTMGNYNLGSMKALSTSACQLEDRMPGSERDHTIPCCVVIFLGVTLIELLLTSSNVSHILITNSHVSQRNMKNMLSSGVKKQEEQGYSMSVKQTRSKVTIES